MDAMLRSIIVRRITALALISSIMVTGFIPQRAGGMKYSLVLALGEAGRTAMAAIFVSVHDPLIEIARMLANEIILPHEDESAGQVAPTADTAPIPAAADVAFTGTAGSLPDHGCSVLSRMGLQMPEVSSACRAPQFSRAGPALFFFDSVGQSIQMLRLLLLLMACQWVSSTGAVRRFMQSQAHPVFL